MVFLLAPWYLYGIHGVYICAMLFTLVPGYSYLCLVIYNGARVFILCAMVVLLVQWCSYRCNGIYIGALVFIFGPWYLYVCHGINSGALVFILVTWTW